MTPRADVDIIRPEFAARLPTPALIVDRRIVERNIARMIELAGSASRLRPHLKTPKMRSVVERYMAAGITRFKCATLAEAQMAAQADARDVLIAYPLIGPHLEMLSRLVDEYPQCRFGTIVDHIGAARALALQVGRTRTIDVWLDLDVGMTRTGVAPDQRAEAMYAELRTMAGLNVVGLHVYDGQVREGDAISRRRQVEESWAPIAALRERLAESTGAEPRIVAGGTPTFADHAALHDGELAPGTCVFWDYGYETKFPDLKFEGAAWVLTRAVSKPAVDVVTFDMGTKSLASEMPWPRAQLPGLEDATLVQHNEEHLTVRSAGAARLSIGTAVLAWPWHICPTVALYSEASVVDQGKVVDRWAVVARDRVLAFDA